MTVERDLEKRRLCEEHGIKILYFSNAHINYPYHVFESMKLLLKAIRKTQENAVLWIIARRFLAGGEKLSRGLVYSAIVLYQC